MIIKHIFFLLVIQFLTLNTVSANEDVVFFDGTMLSIPAISSEKQDGAYQKVQFKLLADGKWELLDYMYRAQVEIKKVSITLTETRPIQGLLTVSGTYMNGCESIKKVRHQLVGNTFKVSVDDAPIASKPIPDSERPICTMNVVDFSEVISLPLYGLKSGEYKYTVNDKFSGVFNLSSDNK